MVAMLDNSDPADILSVDVDDAQLEYVDPYRRSRHVRFLRQGVVYHIVFFELLMVFF